MPSHPKKIVIVTHYYPPHLGGIEMVAKDQAERLARHGHTVTVVTSRVADAETSGVVGGVRVRRVKAWNGLEEHGVPYPLFRLSLFGVLRQAIREADVVHVHDATYVSSVWAAIIARTHRKPLVVTQHVGIVSHPRRLVMIAQKILYATAGHFVYRSSCAVLTLNDRVEKHVAAHGAASKRITNAVDIDTFYPATSSEKCAIRKQLGLSLTKPVVLFVGRFVPKKGFDTVLAARDSGYQLVCAGGEASPFTDDDLVLAGTVPHTELAAYYRAADVFVLPSEGEGFPLSIQEAMAAGLPIITRYDEGYRRYNLDTRLVKLLHQPNEHSVRAAIQSVLQNNDLKRAMGVYSRDYARTHFSWDNVIANLETTYDVALARAAT